MKRLFALVFLFSSLAVMAQRQRNYIYLFDCNKPVETYTGKVIAVYHRTNDVEDKWIVVPENSKYATNPSALSDEEILKSIEFQEKFFAGRLYR